MHAAPRNTHRPGSRGGKEIAAEAINKRPGSVNARFAVTMLVSQHYCRESDDASGAVGV